MRNPFNSNCKTEEEILKILRKAHLSLVEIDASYMPVEVSDKKGTYERVLLKYIWKFQNKLAGKKLR